MPLYRFEMEVTERPDVVTNRLRSVTRPRPGFFDALRDVFSSTDNSGLPFVGTVEKYSFRIERNISYRNSFLPQVSGLIVPTARGAHVSVTMFMHPLVAAFMVIWLSMAGFAVWNALNQTNASEAYVSLGMFVFGVALSVGSFVPEAIKAKRLLHSVILSPNSTSS